MRREGPASPGAAAHADTRYLALFREAVVALDAGNIAGAQRAARVLLQTNPREHAAWRVLTVAALRSGQPVAAVDAAEHAHKLDRKNPDYLNLLGIAYADAGRYEEALGAYRRALKLRPAFADVHYNVGTVHEWSDRLHEAEEALRRALLIEPRHADARHNLARILLQRGKLDEAVATAREAHRDRPEDVERIVNLARALADTEGIPAGIEFVAQSLRDRPETPRLHDLLAIFLLSLGDWRAGWREYTWRNATNRLSDGSLQPLPGDLAGRAVCLAADQGIGDILFFLRFAGGIRARAGKVLVRVPPPLAPLLAGHPLLDFLVPAGEPLPEAIPVSATLLLGDLPYALGAVDVPPPFPVTARGELVDEWRTALAALGPPPYLGLTWRAGFDPRTMSQFALRKETLFKRIALDPLARAIHAAPGTLVSLQRLPAPGETERLAERAGRPVHDLSRANEDLERITALLAVLDDYVGVSNTNMHLRVGLGLTARVIVPYPPEWRWMAGGDSSPWFPSFRIYRQRPDRSWDDAVGRLAADLRTA